MPDANYHQEHKDDPNEWEDEPEEPRRQPSRRLATMVSARFTPDEVELLRAQAIQSGLSLSAFIRDAALARCRAGERGQSMRVTSSEASGSGLSSSDRFYTVGISEVSLSEGSRMVLVGLPD